ncbi:MAG: DUF4089 domain-containing protein [Prochloraceae cyanobacterium]|nr:DUF4089 domain-containing protein [Prochloraceae cyanobacterium]
MKHKKTEIAEYVQKTAELLDIEIKSEYLPEVVENFTKIAEIATLVTEFNLPETIEPAATFKP